MKRFAIPTVQLMSALRRWPAMETAATITSRLPTTRAQVAPTFDFLIFIFFAISFPPLS